MSLGALAVLAGGCSGTEPAEPASPAEATDADSQNEAEPSADETASGPPDVDPPEVPDIHRDDDEGAQNAAEYFLELYTYAFTSGSTAELEGVSSPSCRFCSSLVEDIKSLHESRRFRVGGQFNVIEASVYPPTEADPQTLIRMVVTEGGVELREYEGGVVGEDSSTSEATVDMALSYGASSWSIEGVEINADD